MSARLLDQLDQRPGLIQIVGCRFIRGPMPPLNLYHAKAHLSELVERAARGEEIVIAKAGRPRARLVQLASPVRSRQPGAWKQKVWIADDFDSPPPASVQPTIVEPQRPRVRSRAR